MNLSKLRESEVYQKLYPKLCKVHESPEGNTLEIVDEETCYAQVNFHLTNLLYCSSSLGLDQPIRVLEIGTNKGMFGLLLLYLQTSSSLKFQLTTIDPNVQSVEAVALLEEAGLDCQFICGDSRMVVPILSEEFDYAWIDGNHQTEFALKDIQNCSAKKIPVLAIDDTAYASVQAAINSWFPGSEYQFLKQALDMDVRKAKAFYLEPTVVNN